MNRWMILCVIAAALAGCCRTGPAEPTKCGSDAECTTLCVGYAHATCGSAGFCSCGDSIPVVKQQCQSATDCACSSGTASCGLDGYCYCATESEVQVPKACASVSDCSCPQGHGDPLCGVDGLCYCATEKVVEQPKACDSVSDCACSSGTASCGLDGYCYCATESEVQVPKACASVSDCSCPQGHGDPLCGIDGLCYCNQVQVVEVGACAANADCACSSGAATCGQDGMCYCTNTVSSPTECPAITRQEFVLRMYTALDLDCAQPTCADVNGSCAWGALEKAGIVNASSQCRPNDKMVRAEVVKMIVTAINGLFDYEAPATPTFSDVPTTTWYYDYVEAGVQLGLVTGYLDSSGNLTGLFGPGNWASTCWAQELVYQGVKPVVKPEPKVVLVNNGPVSFITSTGSVGVAPLGFSITSNQDLTAKGSRLEIKAYDALGKSVMDATVYDLLKNVRIVDIDSGATISGPRISAANWDFKSSGTDVWANLWMPDDFELVGGETRHLAVVNDVDQSFPSGYSYLAEFHFRPDEAPWTTYLEDLTHNRYLDSDQLVGDPVVGQRVMVESATLSVSKASVPVSGTHVQGSPNIPVLGIALTAGLAKNDTLMRIPVIVYGNSAPTPWANALGDTAANTIVGSVMLYDGVDVVQGPKSLSLADANMNGVYDAGSDYYVAWFELLGFQIPKGSTKVLTARASLLNSLSAVRYLAMDVGIPQILAEDADHNAVPVTGSALNGTVNKDPQITVLTSGSLAISASNSPLGANVAPGSTMVKVANYRSSALYEGFLGQKLTVINDLSGAFDAPTATLAVSQVAIRFVDFNGVTQTKVGSLAGGSVTFSGLTCFFPSGQDAYVEVFADISTMASVGPGLIGSRLRLGILEANSVSTVSAIGVSSNWAVMPTVSGGAGVGEFTVQ